MHISTVATPFVLKFIHVFPMLLFGSHRCQFSASHSVICIGNIRAALFQVTDNPPSLSVVLRSKNDRCQFKSEFDCFLGKLNRLFCTSLFCFCMQLSLASSPSQTLKLGVVSVWRLAWLFSTRSKPASLPRFLYVPWFCPWAPALWQI